MSEENEEQVVNGQDDKTDSFEWGAAAKDCKAKFYCNLKNQTDDEIKDLIVRANALRKFTQASKGAEA